jgi:hypothetical protein
MLCRTSIALGLTIAALIVAASLEGASAQVRPNSPLVALVDSQSIATSRPSNRNHGEYDRQPHQQRLLGARSGNSSSGAYGIPQALPGSKMNRGGMRGPAMRIPPRWAVAGWAAVSA